MTNSSKVVPTTTVTGPSLDSGASWDWNRAQELVFTTGRTNLSAHLEMGSNASIKHTINEVLERFFGERCILVVDVVLVTLLLRNDCTQRMPIVLFL